MNPVDNTFVDGSLVQEASLFKVNLKVFQTHVLLIKVSVDPVHN